MPGAGRPFALDELARVPEELRSAYLPLKSAGILPEELQLRRELVRVGDLVAASHDEGAKRQQLAARTSEPLLHAQLLEKRGFGPGHQDYAERIAPEPGEDARHSAE